MSVIDPCFTSFNTRINDEISDNIPLPKKFTYPFCYEADPLSILAAQELQQHLLTQTDWQYDFESNGKMFGVLVVKNQQDQLGYLSAFSGKLADQNHLPNFVPPVFDMLKDEGFFLEGTAPINVINQEIKTLEQASILTQLNLQLEQEKQQAQIELETLRLNMIESRRQRKLVRQQSEKTLTDGDLTLLLNELGKQSVAEKAQQKHLKQSWAKKITDAELRLNQYNAQIDALKQRRKTLSSTLQNKLFEQYQFLNQYQQQKSLLDIFGDVTPPAGSGECAAPKLLHYAFKHHYTPICMAEFWWGSSPKSEIRQHKKFYPSCQNKCQPILAHMLHGIELDDNPLLKNHAQGKEIEIIYKDDAIVVVNKPAEFLSVPGVNVQDSVSYRLQKQFSDTEGLFVLHRLDMSTSGLLVFALTRRANKSLQKQFITRLVKKRYVALLEGKLDQTNGDINLPLRGDLDDRPRQMVCDQHGKPAETHWELIEHQTADDNQIRSKVYLYPKTGRTHQLRVHCAHIHGLNMPIVGDDLYGTKANRLYLHAQKLEFSHPYNKKWMHFEVNETF
ncbi:RNA pseudouridine synthase [Vibrio sp. S17_S38]|uniref:RluA family pseudouridine synthase n=1 Tax=Vibrio sp. S17_S38 TaxID=2720229 RepID=UPI0016806CB4|nr:RluA family pseudouridine synthase [Vibrio sp. S17_S38]MBD1573374.1 RNA pseudouridine synthase [Vibrio sp. S17_S38]